MKRRITCLLSLLCVASAVDVSAAPAPHLRGWYEAGATVVEDAELESFLNETTSHNKVEFDPGFRGAIAVGTDLTRYVAIEAEGGFHYNNIRSISGASSDSGELYQFPILGNLVLQFPNRTGLLPVVGGGVGAVFSMLHGDDIAIGASRFSSTEETWSFAYQGYAGLLYSFRPDMALGLSYHYIAQDSPSWEGREGEDIEFDRIANHSLTLSFTFRF